MLKTDPNQLPEDDIILKSAEGNEAARDDLVSACLPRIWRTVYLTCGNNSDTEDLVQISMIRILENLHSYKGPGKFAAWLDRVTINEVRKFFSKKMFRLQLPFSDDLDDFPASRDSAPDHRAEGLVLLEQLARHLKKIRPKNRLALVLSLAEGYTAPEIAEMLGCTVEAAWKRMRRGHSQLHKYLDADPQFERDARGWLA